MTKPESSDLRHLLADKEAEGNLLSSIISKPSLIEQVMTRVTEHDFYYPAHRTIYNAILTLHTRPSVVDANPIDRIAIWNELKATGKHAGKETGLDPAGISETYLQSIAELSPSLDNITYYVDLVLDYSQKRKDLLMSEDIGKNACKPEESDEKTDQLEVPQADMKVVGLGDRLVQQAQNLHGNAPGRVDSGFITLDHHTSGFYPGDLIVIGARPSMGKTSLILNIALNAALAGTGVLFISLEMTVSQLRSRALCMLAGLSLSEVRHNPNLENEKKNILFEAAKKYEQENPPLFITNAGHTPEEQIALIRHYKQKHHIGMVAIDYFQLMITDHRHENERHMATELCRAIKRIAQTEELPILVASQLSPEQEGRKDTYPRMADLRDFGTLDQDADLIMLLYREDYYRRKDKSYGTTSAFEIDIAKHRNGPTGHVKLMFDMERMMFKDYIGVM